MTIDLELYRGFDGKEKYKLKEQIDLLILKNKRKSMSKEQAQQHLKTLYFNQILKRVNDLRLQMEELKQREQNNEFDETR